MISIVIVNWNTRELLKACLKSIFQQTDKNLIEVIVIDNHSADTSCDMVREEFTDVILIENDRNTGFASANNQGFQMARGKYVLMLNSDTEILDNALEKVLSYAEHNENVGIIGCKLLYPDLRFQNSCFRFPGLLSILLSGTYLSQIFKKSPVFNQDRYGNQEWFKERNVDCVMGSFLFIQKKLLDQVGFLDTDFFMYGEEADLCYRVKKAGYQIRYYPDTHSIHVWGGSQKQSELSAWRYIAITRGILLFISKNKSLLEGYFCSFLTLLFLIPRVVAWALADLLNAARKRTSAVPQLPKAKLGLFLLKVLVKPAVLLTKWEGKK